MSYVTRVITRDQAQEWELAYHAPGELSREFMEERRWYSVWQVVFTAPDDGLIYSAQYRRPATEMQEIDPWDEEQEVMLTLCSPREKTVTEWVPVKEGEWVPVEEVYGLGDSQGSGS